MELGQSKMLLSGNEAVARAAFEAGAEIGVGYPGTPSTETLETFARFEGVYAEWAPNEKVAMEVAAGASMAGARCLVTMKHVGVNVAADPLYSIAYTGVSGGLVMLAADDPGIFSSQNEQDTRFHALGAHVPLIEPSNPGEAYEMGKLAFEISERFDTPVIIRSTVRMSHTKSIVEVGERVERELIPYSGDPSKWVMMPAFAKRRRKFVDRRTAELAEYSCELALAEHRDASIGVICAGVVYEQVREALPEASTLKIGMPYPLPAKAIAEFAERVERLYVIEEASSYLSSQVAALGIALDRTPSPMPLDDEVTPAIIRKAFGEPEAPFETYGGDLPGRPPMLCAGCPHRLVFHELSRMGAIVTGDIGCYTLGTLAPLSAMSSCVDMGASISMAHGMEIARRFGKGAEGILADKPIVGVIGDSTFAHSGITSLLGTVYNQGSGIVCILDNRTTAMTGQQGNPVNGITLQNRPSRELDLVELCKSLGVEDVQSGEAQDMAAVREAFKHARKFEGLSVIVFCGPCQLLVRERKAPVQVAESCRACRACIKIGCPALGTDEVGHALVDSAQCIGCGQCVQVCPFDCISVGAGIRDEN